MEFFKKRHQSGVHTEWCIFLREIVETPLKPKYLSSRLFFTVISVVTIGSRQCKQESPAWTQEAYYLPRSCSVSTSPDRGGGYHIQSWWGGGYSHPVLTGGGGLAPSSPDWKGTPIQSQGGVPHPVLMGGWGYPHPVPTWGTPHPVMTGVTPSSPNGGTQGTPDLGWSTPSSWPGKGGYPVPNLGRGTPSRQEGFCNPPPPRKCEQTENTCITFPHP